MRVAFVADGRLHVADGAGGSARETESEFAKQVRERALSSFNRASWRGEGQSFEARMATGQRSREFVPPRVAVTGACAGPGAGEISFGLDTGDVGGLFTRAADGAERRLFHTERFRVRHVAAHPSGEWLACAVSRGGVANLAVMERDGSALTEVTEGDSLDLAPSWAPGPGRRIVYQSAGLSRDARHAGRLSPFGIHELDLDTGKLDTLAEETDRDLLSPRVGADGSLWFVSCPHAPPRASALHAAKEAALAPVRFVQGVFHFFEFFRRVNTGQRPTLAGGPRRALDDQSMKQLLVHGTPGGAQGPEEPDVPGPEGVSSAWELVRKWPDGRREVIAHGVAAFDLGADGSVLMTDGRTIHVRLADGTREKVATAHLVQQVVALG